MRQRTGPDEKTTWIHLRVAQAALRSARSSIMADEADDLAKVEASVTELFDRIQAKYPRAQEMAEEVDLAFNDNEKLND